MRAWTKKVSGEAHESYFELQGTTPKTHNSPRIWGQQKVQNSCLKLILQLVEHLCCVRNSPEDKNNDYDDNGGDDDDDIENDDDDIENDDDLDDDYDGDLSAQGTSCEWPDSQLIHELPSIDLPSLQNWTKLRWWLWWLWHSKDIPLLTHQNDETLSLTNTYDSFSV